jgi:hypothetical protein
MNTTPFDFAAAEERARGMALTQLWGAITDIRKTLPLADADDRANGTDRGGRYRDEASVYHREIRRRGTCACEGCIALGTRTA